MFRLLNCLVRDEQKGATTKGESQNVGLTVCVNPTLYQQEKSFINQNVNEMHENIYSLCNKKIHNYNVFRYSTSLS